MPKSGSLLPAALIFLGISLLACGVFTAIPTLVPTLASKSVPSATNTVVPQATKVLAATAKPADTATPAPLPSPTETPAGLDGKTLLVQRCNGCHSSSIVSQLRGTADQWAGLVDAMVQNGADLNPQEEKVLAGYLAQKYH